MQFVINVDAPIDLDSEVGRRAVRLVALLDEETKQKSGFETCRECEPINAEILAAAYYLNTQS